MLCTLSLDTAILRTELGLCLVEPINESHYPYILFYSHQILCSRCPAADRRRPSMQGAEDARRREILARVAGVEPSAVPALTALTPRGKAAPNAVTMGRVQQQHPLLPPHQPHQRVERPGAVRVACGIGGAKCQQLPKACRIPWRGSKRVLFTCTTFLGRPGKVEQARAALESLHRAGVTEVADCLVINEHPPVDASVLGSLPLQHCTFVQKSHECKGQARSLNQILDILRTHRNQYDVWLQWEESWVCNAPLAPILALMDEEAAMVDQLQLNEAWEHVSRSTVTPHVDILQSPSDFVPVLHWNQWDPWPLFSLQPSLNRVQTVLHLGEFPEEAHLWPIQFEYMFAIRWLRSGLVKGVLRRACASRQSGHASTYSR
jgi:hypothetical protein